MRNFFLLSLFSGKEQIFFFKKIVVIVHWSYIWTSVYNASLIPCLKYLYFLTFINSVWLLVGTQKPLFIFLNYCESEGVPLTLLIQFQLPAGTVVSKSGPGCLSVSDLLPGRLLALFDLLHVYGKSCQRDRSVQPTGNIPHSPWKLIFTGALEALKPWLVQFYCFLKIWSWWRNVRGNWMQMDIFCFCCSGITDVLHVPQWQHKTIACQLHQ